MMILSACEPLGNGKASTLEHQIDIPESRRISVSLSIVLASDWFALWV